MSGVLLEDKLDLLSLESDYLYFGVWIKPPSGWFKLDVDGARSGNGLIGVGGVIRDSTGSWCAGFAACNEKGSVLEAEIWGLLLGLELAATNLCIHLLVDCDSAILVEMINKGLDDLHPLKTMIDNCRFLQNGFSTCEIRHVYRKPTWLLISSRSANLVLTLELFVFCNLLHMSPMHCWMICVTLQDLGR